MKAEIGRVEFRNWLDGVSILCCLPRVQQQCGWFAITNNKLLAWLMVVLLLVLSAALLTQEASAATLLDASDLPSETQTLTVTTNTTLTINAGENATSAGTIYVNSTDGAKPIFQIVNNGELTVKSHMIVTGANLTIRNTGTLTLTSQNITLTGNASLTILNTGTMNLNNSGLMVYGGVAHITNNGSLSATRWQLKDQYDGTMVNNNGDVTLHECSFKANGAYGQYVINNNGNLQATKTYFNADYGGTISLNSFNGNLTMQDGGMAASGWSHGKQASISIVASNAEWANTVINGYGGSIIYSDYGLGGTVQNCSFSYIGNFNQMGNKNCTDCTLSNFGNFANTGNSSYSNCKMNDIHNMSNNGNLTLRNVSFDSGNSTNLANLGNIQLWKTASMLIQ